MSPQSVAFSASKPADDGTPSEKSAGGAGAVEIVNFPQILYTRTFGDPDMLFVPLLDATRQAYAMIERLSSHGESVANAAMLSGMQLASSLLRDSSFSLVARGLSHDHTYAVDLAANTLCVNTRLYAAVSRRTSLFKVEISGKISGGGSFVVRNRVQGAVIMQVEEERLRRPNFFATSLAQECLRSQMEQERFGRIEETLGPQSNGEVRLVLNVAGSKVPVTLQQKEQAAPWDIIDGRVQEWVGTLAPEADQSLKTLTAFLQTLFAHK